jgi:hypothetical protein
MLRNSQLVHDDYCMICVAITSTRYRNGNEPFILYVVLVFLLSSTRVTELDYEQHRECHRRNCLPFMSSWVQSRVYFSFYFFLTRYSQMFKYKNQTHLFSITYHCGMHDNELYFYLDPANIKQCLTEATGSDYNGPNNNYRLFPYLLI